MTQTKIETPAMKNRQAFTLVEILIVVVILGILAAVVVPQFTSATDESRANTVRMDLYRIRTQLELYKEHHGHYPAMADFTNQMTLSSDKNGDTAVPGTEGYPYGPYIREVPVNPDTNTSSVGNGNPGSSAWYYDENTGTFKANSSDESRQW